MAHPENRAEASRDGAHLHDGRSVGYWYGLTPGHIFSIIEAPDELVAAALLSAMFSSGAFENLRTEVLLIPEQMMEAMIHGSKLPYSPPGGKGDVEN